MNVLTSLHNLKITGHLILACFTASLLAGIIVAVGMTILRTESVYFIELIKRLITDFLNLLYILYTLNIIYNTNKQRHPLTIGLKNKFYVGVVLFSIGLNASIYFLKYRFKLMCFPVIFLSIYLVEFVALSLAPLLNAIITFITVLCVIMSPLLGRGPMYRILYETDSNINLVIAVNSCGLLLVLTSILASTIARSLKAQQKALEKSLKDRTAFFAHISHEFRTPLSIIKSLTEEMQYDQGKNYKDDIMTIHNAAITMTRNVNDLLDLFKLNNKEIQLNPEYCILECFIKSIKHTFITLATLKNIALHDEISPRCSKPVKIDKYRLTQILYNLINNAIKYTHEGSITLKVDLEDDYEINKETYLIVSIIDTGIGLTASECTNILQDFYRSGNVQDIVGTGLGLSIVQHIVSKMDGVLTVESDGLNCGSTFKFKIKTMYCRESRDSINTIAKVQNLDIYENLSVLIVEDSVPNAKILKRIIGGLSSTIICEIAGTCAKAYEYIDANKIDIIFLDLGLPDGNGVDVKKYIFENKNESINQISVVIITATVLEFIDKDMKKYKNVHYCFKPFSRKDILDTVEKITLQRLNLIV